MKKNSRIYIAGHTGMVGSAILRKVQEKGYQNVIVKSLEDLDLINQQAVSDFFKKEKPEYVFIAAAKVGGIMANNTYRAQFIYENLMIQNNLIHHSYLNGVRKLLFLGSSCIYPKNCPQPIKEEYLLTGELENTNEPYALAKIAGIKMCENYYLQYGCNFLSVMPTNLYGPNDNYNLETSHVLPAIIRKMHLAKCLETNDWNALRQDLNKRPIEGVNGVSSEEEIIGILNKYGIKKSNRKSTCKNQISVSLWGTGQVYREFMYVDDMADACLKIMEEINISDIYQLPKSQTISNIKSLDDSMPSTTFLNIGTGKDQTIQELAFLIKKIVDFTGTIHFDPSKPDGTYKKLLDISRLKATGYTHHYTLVSGVEKMYDWYLKNLN